jgi:transposase
MEKDITGVRNRILTMLPILDEYQRRIFLASEAQMFGYGGISCISRISGVSRVTITHGINEIENQNVTKQSNGGSRKKGGGRKSINESQPGIIQELEELLEGHTKGDPMTPLIWTSKSVRHLEKTLKERGYRVSYVTVSSMLKELGSLLSGYKSNRFNCL